MSVEQGRYVLKLDGFSDMMESSDETAIDSLEPELVEIASHDTSNQDLMESNIQLCDQTIRSGPAVAAGAVDDSYLLRRPQFRVDVDPDLESQLLMTSQEADSLLSSR